MKKIRIEVKPEAASKSITLFDSSEALYMWLSEPASAAHPQGSFQLVIEQGEFLEIEWCGCEYVYEANDICRRLDVVRIAKGMPTKNGSGLLVSIHSGWVTDYQLRFKDAEDESSYTMLLATPLESKLDLGLLFGDDETDEQAPDETVTAG